MELLSQSLSPPLMGHYQLEHHDYHDEIKEKLISYL